MTARELLNFGVLTNLLVLKRRVGSCSLISGIIPIPGITYFDVHSEDKDFMQLEISSDVTIICLE